MKKPLLIICVVAIQVVSIMVGVLLSFTGEKVCHTGKCRRLSQNIQGSMKTVIHPCDDFYEFSCGNYEKHNDAMSDSTMLLKEKLMNILNEPVRPSEPRFIQLRKQLMRQCLDDHDAKTMIKNLKSVIELVGGFPTVDTEWWSKEEPRWTFEQAVGKFREAGLFTNMFMDIGASLSPFNNSKLIFVSSNPQVVLNFCDPACQSRLYVKIAVLLGADNKTATDDVQEIVELEMMLTEGISQQSSPLPDAKKDDIQSINELISNFDFLDWNAYFKGILGKEPVNSNSFLLVLNKNYLSFLKEKYKTIKKRVIANYMIWYNVVAGLTYIPGRNRSEWECLVMKETIAGIVNPISNYIVLQYKDESGYGIVQHMTDRIKNELIKTIDNLPWMDEITKQKAKVKVNKMKRIIGYPKPYLNTKFIDEFYEKLKLGDNYLLSLLNLKRFDDYVGIQVCYFGSVKDEFCQFYVESLSTMVDNVNAFYNILANVICIPDAILKPPIFDPGWPNYINYGKIGMVVAHEITHGFDSFGAQYDGDGNKNAWWKPATMEKFTQKTKCFVDHFSKFKLNITSGLVNVNGLSTLSENIADAGGLNLAFKAYRESADDRFLPELKLPNLDYTQEQLFLIANAQLWCHGQYSSREGMIIINDAHSPNPVRVRAGLQDFPFLGDVFGCKVGDKMNPRLKCEIW